MLSFIIINSVLFNFYVFGSCHSEVMHNRHRHLNPSVQQQQQQQKLSSVNIPHMYCPGRKKVSSWANPSQFLTYQISQVYRQSPQTSESLFSTTTTKNSPAYSLQRMGSIPETGWWWWWLWRRWTGAVDVPQCWPWRPGV